MAEVLLLACEPAAQICKLSVINQTSQCNACKVYKDQIKLLTQELLSSKKIIQLLQEDLRTFKEPPHATNTEHQDERINPQVSNSDSSWKTASTKTKYSSNLNKSNNCYKYTRIPVVPITNRYDILHNLQPDHEHSTEADWHSLLRKKHSQNDLRFHTYS
jgi:hypothetical protein